MGKDIFVSYSRKDEDAVLPIVERLERIGYSVWIDKEGIESGDSFKRVIVRAIEECNVVLFFSSKNSNKSPWTSKEVGVAVYEQKHIIPILLDDSKYNGDVKFDLINLDYIDFRQKNRAKQEQKKLEDSLTRLLTIKAVPNITQSHAEISSEPQRDNTIGKTLKCALMWLRSHKAEGLLGLAILILIVSKTIIGCILAIFVLAIYLFGKRCLNGFRNKKVIILIISVSGCFLGVFFINNSMHRYGHGHKFTYESSPSPSTQETEKTFSEDTSLDIDNENVNLNPIPIETAGYIGQKNAKLMLRLYNSSTNVQAYITVLIDNSLFEANSYLHDQYLKFNLLNEDGISVGILDGLLYMDGVRLKYSGQSRNSSGSKNSPIQDDEFEFSTECSEWMISTLTDMGVSPLN